VCGIVVSAALYAGTTKSMLRAYALEDPEPQTVLHRLNQALYREMCEDTRFVSLLYGILDLDADTFTYANAGHPPPVRYDPTSGRCDRLPVTGIIAGAFPDMRFQQRSVALPPGAALVLFTDGVVEAAGEVDPFDDGGISDLLAGRPEESAEAIAQAICECLALQAGRELTDDVTLVVIRRE
jgi:sigma-B regulation protein RsbU (phosphoserine phosphatase)